MKASEAAEALGTAWRNDWSDFDGRTLRSQLEDLDAIYVKEHRGEDVTEDVRSFIEINGPED